MPESEAAGRLQAELTARGVRMTQQRRTILSIIETAKQHLDASQILRRAKKFDSSVDRVTVYRTLSLLKRHGLVDELDLLHLRGRTAISTSAAHNAIICTWRVCDVARSWSSRAAFSSV